MNLINSLTAAEWSDAERLAALARYRILDTPREAAFDDLAALAAHLCAAPAAAIDFIADDSHWCKAAFNLESLGLAGARALYEEALLQAQPLAVAELPGQGAGAARACAAVMLRTADGLPLGVLSVLDETPRAWTMRQLDHLQVLARQVMALLELRLLRQPEPATGCTAQAQACSADTRGAGPGSALQTFDDLAGRCRQQVQTCEAEQSYRALVELSPHAAWQCAADGALRLCNAYWCDFTGLSNAASQGAGWLAAVAPEMREQVARQWPQLLQTHQPCTLELPLLSAAGEPRWFQARGAPVHDADGQLLHWVFVAQDIDDRYRADARRQASEAFTHLLLDSASEGIVSIDPRGRVSLCNRAFVTLLGFSSKEDVLGRPLYQVIHQGHPDGSPCPAHDSIQRAALTGEALHVEYALFQRVDGGSLPVEYRVAPLYCENLLHGAICTFTDISERTRGEAMRAFLLELSDQLQQSPEGVDLSCLLSERLGRLLAVEHIAHGRIDGQELIIEREWRQGGSASVGRHPLGTCAERLATRLAQDLVVPFEAPANDSALRQRLAGRSLLLAPLCPQDSGNSLLLLASRQTRVWSQADINLLREIVERIRNAHARASARKALLEAEQRISLANAIASIGVWEYAPGLNRLLWDKPLKSMAGLPPEQPPMRVDELLTRVHVADRVRLLDALNHAIDADSDGELCLDYRVRDARTGEYRWFANCGRRLRDAAGQVRLLGTARDITAERSAAQELLQINTLLQEQIEERHQTQLRQTALMELGDLLREQPDSLTIGNAALRAIGSTLNVTRAALASVDPSGNKLAIERYWIEGELRDYPESLALPDYGDFARDLRNDELVAIDDILDDVRTAAHAPQWLAWQIRSVVCVPLFEQGQLSAVLVLLQRQPRRWTEQDIAFIREVADRAWTADERMRAERALRASEEQFRTLADNMSQFAWMADPGGRVYWYNKRWYDYTGTTFEAMRALGWRAVHHPEHHERVRASMKRAMAIGSTWEDTFPLRGKDGRYRWYLARALPIRDEHGHVTRWFGTNTDVTAQVAAEEALRELNDNLERRVAERTRELAEINERLHVEMSERERAEEALRHAQKMEAIGQLTGGLAHDFNNMLTGVLGGLDLIRRHLADKSGRELDRYIDAAVTSANRAAALTHRLLAFARRQSLDPKSVDVNLLVVSMEDMLRRTIGEHIQLGTQLRPDAWLAFTDAHQLENALLNLVINARDAMPGGGRLTIHTDCLTVDSEQPDGLEPGPYVTLAVADSGTGMSAEVLAKAFDPFFTTKPIGQGTGLGLSMVYGFAKQTGGHVRIDSTLGEGTRITLFLPRSQALAELAAPPAAQVLEIPQARAGETVLVVEDEAAVRMLIVEVLRELGYAVLEATDANAALPQLQSTQRIDLLVSDFGLPGLNGCQLVVRARQHRPGLKALIVTGYAPNAEVRGDFLGPGMDMLAKPFNIDALAIMVRQLIDRHSAPPAADRNSTADPPL